MSALLRTTGSESKGYFLVATAQVVDALGAAAPYVYRSVEVKPLSQEQQNVQLSKLIESSDGSLDYNRKLITTVSATLNSPNCSMSFDCSIIHRLGCLKTPHICGNISLSIFVFSYY